jgi:hypothetical protein
VDIAKDVADAGFVKVDEARAACFVQTQVEALAVEKRKDVVEEWVAIGELYRSPSAQYNDSWLEAFVLLHEAG